MCSKPFHHSHRASVRLSAIRAGHLTCFVTRSFACGQNHGCKSSNSYNECWCTYGCKPHATTVHVATSRPATVSEPLRNQAQTQIHSRWIPGPCRSCAPCSCAASALRSPSSEPLAVRYNLQFCKTLQLVVGQRISETSDPLRTGLDPPGRDTVPVGHCPCTTASTVGRIGDQLKILLGIAIPWRIKDQRLKCQTISFGYPN